MSKISFIGLGNMGAPLSMNLIKGGHELTVWDLAPEKIDPILAFGAKAADSPKDSVSNAEYIFISVPNSAALESVIGGELGLDKALVPGQIVVDLSTVSYDMSVKAAEAIAKTGAQFLRTPLSGSTALALSGTLTTLSSGPQDAYDKTKPLLDLFGKTHFYFGDGDCSRIVKLALNMMIAISMQMLAESLVLAEKAEIDFDLILDVINNSAVASPLFGYKSPPLRNRDYSPAFSSLLMAKDLDLALESAKSLGVSLPVTGLVRQFLGSLVATGKGQMDFASLLLLAEEASGLEPKVVI
jgi:3-hydroxyisobutyrate dehydrogenase-like beta-hydroxyacid dehydrogenase